MDNYECENQMDIEEWLWDSGYYMPLPTEEREDKENEEHNT